MELPLVVSKVRRDPCPYAHAPTTHSYHTFGLLTVFNCIKLDEVFQSNLVKKNLLTNKIRSYEIEMKFQKLEATLELLHLSVLYLPHHHHLWG